MERIVNIANFLGNPGAFFPGAFRQPAAIRPTARRQPPLPGLFSLIILNKVEKIC